MNAEDNEILVPKPRVSPIDALVEEMAERDQWQPQGTGALSRFFSGQTTADVRIDVGLSVEWWVVLVASDLYIYPLQIVQLDMDTLNIQVVPEPAGAVGKYARFVIPGRDRTLQLNWDNSGGQTLTYMVAAISGIFPGAIF